MKLAIQTRFQCHSAITLLKTLKYNRYIQPFFLGYGVSKSELQEVYKLKVFRLQGFSY